MKRPVIIVGLMRSGTSLVGSIVHYLGFPVSDIIPAPMPPAWRSDWEDPHLSLRLIAGEKINWESHLADRRFLSAGLGFDGRVAMKSPYLALHMQALLEFEPFVIKVVRQGAAIERSFKAHPHLIRRDQERIRAALATIEADLLVSYDALVEESRFGVARIADALGVTDEEALVRAQALVDLPTEYV
jgi:hypothetical protein